MFFLSFSYVQYQRVASQWNSQVVHDLAALKQSAAVSPDSQVGVVERKGSVEIVDVQ